MAEFRLTNKAVEDLNEIWNYTCDNWSEEQADRYYHMLLGLCEEIAQHPEIGKNYDEIAAQLRGLKASRHIVFYRIIETDFIEITRFLHGQMDLKNRIAE